MYLIFFTPGEEIEDAVINFCASTQYRWLVIQVD